MKKTKIVCTLGPATADEHVLEEMLKSGMNVARLNMSHGTHESHRKAIETFRKVRDRLKIAAAVMLDTKGPEIRIGTIKDGKAFLNAGGKLTLTTEEIEGNSEIVSISYKDLPLYLKIGDTVLIDDGRIVLSVVECFENNINCVIMQGGFISNRKGINIPKVRLPMPFLSKQDKEDLLFAIENDVDFISASFVRKKEDVISLREFLNDNGGYNIKIIAKIENLEGIENFDEILYHSNGIMVARGDMGVEVEYERLPGLQKKFIKRCYQSGKMVITATQMLESMITSPTPTRAEITDVANAVFDGTSAVMLSGESAMGINPILAVKVMSRIVLQAESDAFEMEIFKGVNYEMDSSDKTNAICDATCTTARDIEAKAIITVTKSGQTARRMSKFRPSTPIVAATHILKTYHQLSLSWGVYPVMTEYQQNSDDLISNAIECAKNINMVSDGDLVVVAAGFPLDTSGSTNLLKLHVVGSK